MGKVYRLSHIQIIALGYLFIILCGTALLCLPVSVADGDWASPVTALFTAVSASCVTGLVLEDTATYWSFFGQTVILALIQIGGLGFMTVATFFYKVIIKRTGLRERAIMAESINTTRMSNFSALTRKIVAGTVLFEMSGAALMSFYFIPKFGALRGIYYSVFHSVSAFCNAGFDLMGVLSPRSSFTAEAGNVLINTVIMALIIIGGIGFLVWDDITCCRFKFKHFSLNTKAVLYITALLIFAGAGLLFVLELKNPVFSEMPIKEKILTSLFGSVTARTAGFNTTDTAALTSGAKFVTIILMFIGGSPGSTAGGIKTTTAAVLLLFTVSGISGRDGIHLFGRSIKPEAVRKAVVVTLLSLSLALAGTLVLCSQGFSLTDSMFEAFSAMGTVGMTTGITEKFNTVSSLVIAFLMFSGRVGSISFAAAVFERKIKPPVTYPAENINIG